MFASQGCEVLTLHRTHFGHLQLGELPERGEPCAGGSLQLSEDRDGTGQVVVVVAGEDVANGGGIAEEDDRRRRGQADRGRGPLRSRDRGREER